MCFAIYLREILEENLFSRFICQVLLHWTQTDSGFIICKTKQLGTDLFHCSFDLLTYHFSLCFGVFSLSSYCSFWHPYCSFSLFQSVFSLSQADSYPVLPYGLEEFPNGHSDLYHAAWKLWVFFSSSSSLCLTFLFLSPPSSSWFPTFCLACNVSNLAIFQETGTVSYKSLSGWCSQSPCREWFLHVF